MVVVIEGGQGGGGRGAGFSVIIQWLVSMQCRGAWLPLSVCP